MTAEQHRHRITAADQWGQDPETVARVAPLCKRHKVSWQTVGNCWTRLVLSCTDSGTTDLTADQLAQRAYVTKRQAEKALCVLRDAGVLQTLQPGRSPGRGGGKGRGAVRRPVLPALPVDKPENGPPLDRNGPPLEKNGPPPEGWPLRSFSPEPPAQTVRRAPRGNQTGQGGAEKERKNDPPLVAEVARALVNLEPSHTVRDRAGMARYKAGLVTETLAGLEGNPTWQGWLRHGNPTDLVTALASKCRNEPVSGPIADRLDAAVRAAQAVEVA